MIIRKNVFKKSQWPFNVQEVTILLVSVPSEIKSPEGKPSTITCFALIHEFKAFALSGLLANHGFSSLEESNIWAENKEIPGTKISLTPFVVHLNKLLEEF